MDIPFDKQRLRDFSEKHLFYEIAMLYGVHEALETKNFDAQPFIFNALLESFVIHTSIILDFFYQSQRKPDDARAFHFMKAPRKWRKILPPPNREFTTFITHRNKRVVHLSYKRMDSYIGQRPWNCAKIIKEIHIIVDLFLDNASKEYVHPKLYKLHSRAKKRGD